MGIYDYDEYNDSLQFIFKNLFYTVDNHNYQDDDVIECEYRVVDDDEDGIKMIGDMNNE